jgi:hypothetical protein
MYKLYSRIENLASVLMDVCSSRKRCNPPLKKRYTHLIEQGQS